MRISAATYFKLALLLAVGLLTGCGKIGEPLPPIERTPLGVEELRVAQEGREAGAPLSAGPFAARRDGSSGSTSTGWSRRAAIRPGCRRTSSPRRASGDCRRFRADQIPVSRSTRNLRRSRLRLKTLDRRGSPLSVRVRVINTSGRGDRLSRTMP
jgi:hypothetical protein